MSPAGTATPPDDTPPANAPCPACGATLRPHARLRNRFTYFACPTCTMVTARPVPTADELNAFYNGFLYAVPSEQAFQKHEATLREDVRRICRHFTKRTGRPLAGRLLDWGGGAGFFGAAFAAQGLDVTTVDIDEQACRYGAERFGNKIRVVHADPADLPIDQPFDVVLCNHVIEHLPDLDGFIAGLAAALRPGGALLMMTPNQQCKEFWFRPAWWLRYLRLAEPGLLSAAWRFLRRPWVCCDPPRHLHAFNARSLARLLERHGFRVLDAFSESQVNQYHASGRFRPDLAYRRPASVLRMGLHLYTFVGLHLLNVLDLRRRWGNNLVIYAEAPGEK